jgi:hypothetical protein
MNPEGKQSQSSVVSIALSSSPLWECNVAVEHHPFLKTASPFFTMTHDKWEFLQEIKMDGDCYFIKKITR